jgi:hypothetical protein
MSAAGVATWERRVAAGELADQIPEEPKQDKRAELILAYTEAGLIDKANALRDEMLAERLGYKPSGFADIKADLAKMESKLADLADKVADRMGVPRRPRRPK